MEDWITNLGTGLAVAIVTSVVTVRLSLRKFHAERWWERKAEAYNDVLNALSDLKHYSELLAKQAYGAKFTEEHQARLKERHLDGYHKLRSARTIGGFILSEAVAQRLEKLARQDDTIDRDSGPPWEYYEEISGAYADALTDIRAAAKKDLKVE